MDVPEIRFIMNSMFSLKIEHVCGIPPEINRDWLPLSVETNDDAKRHYVAPSRPPYGAAGVINTTTERQKNCVNPRNC